jgi:hypothetical protein
LLASDDIGNPPALLLAAIVARTGPRVTPVACPRINSAQSGILDCYTLR